MPKTVRTKFECERIFETWPGSSAKSVKLVARYDPSIPEDQRFCAMTPTGSLEATIDNPAALEIFTPGRSFYIDVTPIGDAPAQVEFPRIDPQTGEVAS